MDIFYLGSDGRWGNRMIKFIELSAIALEMGGVRLHDVSANRLAGSICPLVGDCDNDGSSITKYLLERERAFSTSALRGSMRWDFLRKSLISNLFRNEFFGFKYHLAERQHGGYPLDPLVMPTAKRALFIYGYGINAQSVLPKWSNLARSTIFRDSIQGKVQREADKVLIMMRGMDYRTFLKGEYYLEPEIIVKQAIQIADEHNIPYTSMVFSTDDLVMAGCKLPQGARWSAGSIQNNGGLAALLEDAMVSKLIISQPSTLAAVFSFCSNSNWIVLTRFAGREEAKWWLAPSASMIKVIWPHL